MPKIARKIIIQAVFGLLMMFVSGISSIIGLAPEDVVDRIIGRERVIYWTSLIFDHMTADKMRWTLVILGDLSFAAGILSFAMIPALLALSKSKTLKVDFEAIEAEYEKYKVWNEGEHERLHEATREADKKLRDARRIHDRTAQMLKRIREIKALSNTEDAGS